MYKPDPPASDVISANEPPASLATILRTIGALFLAGALLATPAVLNRFPFIFYDTSSYISRATFVTHPALRAAHRPVTATVGAAPAASSPKEQSYHAISSNPFFLRPITYSILLVPFSVASLFYFLPFAQGFFCAYVIRRLLRTVGVDGWKPFAGTILGLTALSSLPLHVSYAMPDLFTGILVVMSFVAVLSWPTRSVAGRCWDMLLMAVLIAVHLSHLPIMLALILLYGASAVFLRSKLRLASVMLSGVVPLLVAVIALIGSNYAVARNPVISESSPLFLLARLIGDGPAVAYLTEHCAREPYLLCRHLSQINAHPANEPASDYFLWNPNGAVNQIADPRLVAEASRIDRATITEFPLEVVTNAVRNGFRQLVHFQVDADVNSAAAPFVVDAIANIGPDIAQQYLNSPQARGRYPLVLTRGLVDVGVALALLVVAFVAVRFRTNIPAQIWGFVAVAFTGIAANALATGGLSEVHDRYGNRVIWLAPFTALVLLCVLAQNRGGATQRVEPTPLS